ncbi:hypothetical protein D3C81_2249660 [compost metagenome]
MVAGPPATGAAQARLDFIGNQDCAVLVAQFAHLLQVAGRRHDHPGFGLYRLKDHAGAFGLCLQLQA